MLYTGLGLGVLFAAAVAGKMYMNSPDDGKDFLADRGHTNITGGETTSQGVCRLPDQLMRRFNTTAPNGEQGEVTVCYGARNTPYMIARQPGDLPGSTR